MNNERVLKKKTDDHGDYYLLLSQHGRNSHVPQTKRK